MADLTARQSALGILLLFAVFVVAAALAGGRQADSVREGLKRSQEAESIRFQAHFKELKRLEASQEAMTGQDPRDPLWMGQEGAAKIAILPPAPLAPVAVGQRDLQPQALRLTTEDHLSSQRENETAMSGPTRLMTGAFDLGFLFVFLFPLVVIALSYELLSGERERGTLACFCPNRSANGRWCLAKQARGRSPCVASRSSLRSWDSWWRARTSAERAHGSMWVSSPEFSSPGRSFGLRLRSSSTALEAALLATRSSLSVFGWSW